MPLSVLSVPVLLFYHGQTFGQKEQIFGLSEQKLDKMDTKIPEVCI